MSSAKKPAKKPAKQGAKQETQSAQTAAASLAKPTAVKKTVTAKKSDKIPAAKPDLDNTPIDDLDVDIEIDDVLTIVKSAGASKAKAVKTTLDDLALDIDEKDELLEEEKKDLVKVLREDEDEPLETAFVPTDTSERYILVVDEEGQRRNETMTIVSQILPNAVVEVADDPEEALEIMQEADFDTYVVNFLMPGYSASPFVKAVANHPDHPLLIGFAADKISDALDQKKGLKIIPLKRLFDLDVSTESKDKAEKEE